MFKRYNLNSLGIFDLFHLNPRNFRIHRSNSSNHIFNFKGFLINKLYIYLAIGKFFNTIIIAFLSILLFFDIAFNHLLTIIESLLISKNNKWGGGN